MKKFTYQTLFASVGFAALAIAPLTAQEVEKAPRKNMPHKGMRPGAMKFTKLVAVVHGLGDNRISGTVVFEKVPEGVHVMAKVGGFEPNTEHGFHVHEFGDLGAADGTSAGGHFNPADHDHALPSKEMRHSGDLGNLKADDSGNASLDITVDNFKLDSGKMGILGRAVIIHAKEDDGGQPTGNAGDRIAAGVIGISKDGMPAMKAKDGNKPGMKKDKADMPKQSGVEGDDLGNVTTAPAGTKKNPVEKAADNIEAVAEDVADGAETQLQKLKKAMDAEPTDSNGTKAKKMDQENRVKSQ